jgi:hypothetical protein
MKTEPNHSASPVKQWNWTGLTKREYFAAMAMQGFLASYAGELNSPKPENVAEKSCEYADELIKALNETQP